MRWIAAVYASFRALMIASLAGGTGGVAVAQQGGDEDDAAWGAAQSAGTPEAFQDYLQAFPDGRHIEDAFRGLIVGSTEGARSTRGLAVDMY